MVIAVQSEPTAWQSHLMCNGRPIQWNLRAPLRATLAAAAQLLGGLQPPHLLSQPSLRRTLHNWLWSVGDSPLSHTSSSGVEFTAHQADLVARNGVVAALNASLGLQAEAHALLAPLKASKATWRLFSGAAGPASAASAAGDASSGAVPPLLRLRSAAAKLRELQRRVAGGAARLEWGATTAMLHALQRDSEAVQQMARQVAAAAAARQCEGAARAMLDEEGGGSWYSARYSALLLLLPGLAALLCWARQGRRPGRSRIKINMD